MDERLVELKEKQAEIGSKISVLQQTNKRKDEEAAEIRKLIAECRENLNRIKGTTPGAEDLLGPCSEFDLDEEKNEEKIVMKNEEKDEEKDEDDVQSTRKKSSCGDAKPTSSLIASRKPCGDREKKCKPSCKSVKKGGKERVTCKVDLNKMKVRIRGPSEDLKKLDATQLITLLEKFQCQELIINTGDEIVQDPGEIRLIYLMHPGNLVMLAGIIMVAFLINTNVCNVQYSKNTLFFLNFLNVGCIAFHYGMVLWMTFIRGYALRSGLNPDTFQLVDNIMLPKYYSVCVLLSAVSMYSFLATHTLSPCSSWPLSVIAQIIVMVTTFIMELITICYVIPGVIKLRDATDDYIFDDEDTECAAPESYQKNMVKLCKLNWTLCLINFLTLIFLGANIYYITCQLDSGKKWNSSTCDFP